MFDISVIFFMTLGFMISESIHIMISQVKMFTKESISEIIIKTILFAILFSSINYLSWAIVFVLKYLSD